MGIGDLLKLIGIIINLIIIAIAVIEYLIIKNMKKDFLDLVSENNALSKTITNFSNLQKSSIKVKAALQEVKDEIKDADTASDVANILNKL